MSLIGYLDHGNSYLPSVRDYALRQDKNVIEQENASFLHDLVNTLDRAPSYQYPVLARTGCQHVPLAEDVGHKVDSLAVDLSKLLILVYFTDVLYNILKSDRCELASGDIHLQLVLHDVLDEGVVDFYLAVEGTLGQ